MFIRETDLLHGKSEKKIDSPESWEATLWHFKTVFDFQLYNAGSFCGR